MQTYSQFSVKFSVLSYQFQSQCFVYIDPASRQSLIRIYLSNQTAKKVESVTVFSGSGIHHSSAANEEWGYFTSHPFPLDNEKQRVSDMVA